MVYENYNFDYPMGGGGGVKTMYKIMMTCTYIVDVNWYVIKRKF